jgi:ParB-like chromosome segregation protein Spo0J
MGINVSAEVIAIDSIKPHPLNPRLGDIVAIADSLKTHGQYSPVVIWNDTIIAGTHTWKAAKSLGWKEIAVTRYKGDEDSAMRVLVADNRTSDIAVYNNEILLQLLKAVPELDGTGWETAEIEALNISHELDSGGVAGAGGGGAGKKDGAETVKIRIGEFQGDLDPEIYGIWIQSLIDAVGEKKAKINKELRDRLDVPKEPRAPKKDTKEPPKPRLSQQNFSMGETTLEPISSLKRYPANPREGDIGAISESLRTLGQYRPVVVNRSTREILKGNHTVAGASSLGWTEIAVVWVDVDTVEATKIVLVDNKTSDKATYDKDLLTGVLEDISTLEGTGFDADDFHQEIRGNDTTPKQSKVKFRIGEYGFTSTQNVYETWREEVDLPNDALHRLGLPLTALVNKTEE